MIFSSSSRCASVTRSITGPMARAVQGFHNILARYSVDTPAPAPAPAAAPAATPAAAKRRKVSNQTTTSKE